MAENRQEYIQRTEAQLAEWRTRLDEVKARARKVEGQEKIDYQNRADQISQKMEDAQHRLDELKHSSQSSSDKDWNQIKSDMESAGRDMADSLNDMKRKLGF